MTNVTFVLGCKLAEVQACGLSCTVYVAMSGLIMLGFKKSVIFFSSVTVNHTFPLKTSG